MKNIVIKTKNFTLRFFKKGDEISLAKNLNNKDVSKTLSAVPYPYNLIHAKHFIKKNIAAYKKRNPKSIIFAIDINKEAAGGIGILSIKYGHKAKLGYWLSRKYWGKGIMTEAVKIASNFAFKELKLKRLYAQVFSFNPASEKVLEKNGFLLEGFLKKNIKKGKKFIDCYLLAKVK